MSYYLAPAAGYLGIASLLCLSYCCIECAKGKGRETETSLISCSWIITSVIVGCLLGYGTMVARVNAMYIVIGILLCCVTLVISGSFVYYS